jgi:hypothetical protein
VRKGRLPWFLRAPRVARTALYSEATLWAGGHRPIEAANEQSGEGRAAGRRGGRAVPRRTQLLLRLAALGGVADVLRRCVTCQQMLGLTAQAETHVVITSAFDSSNAHTDTCTDKML